MLFLHTELTDAGRKDVAGLDPDQPAPWEAASEGADDEALDLMGVFESTAAAMQAFRAGTAAHREEAKKILLEARRAL